MSKALLSAQLAVSAGTAWISAKLGILYPVLGILLVLMIIDYCTGMAASKVEAIDHPGDPSYGWSSAKGAKGIIKKFGYLCVIAGALCVDYVILQVAAEIGIRPDGRAFFGLLVAVWYILNETLSVIENAGRMGAPIPDWLRKNIAVLKDQVDTVAGTDEKEEKDGN